MLKVQTSAAMSKALYCGTPLPPVSSTRETIDISIPDMKFSEAT